MDFISNNSKIIGNDVNIDSNVIIMDNCTIIGDKINIKSGTVIESGVLINAETISIGFDCTIGEKCIFEGYGTRQHKKKAIQYYMGDNVFIGKHTTINTSKFIIEDYGVIHSSNIYGSYPLEIGYNVWIGQDTIINTRRMVKMGDNVRIGARSQIWTHSASGEILEGSQLFREKEVVLEDNTWLNGGVTITPGVRMKPWSVVLIGSVLTRDTEKYHIYAGVPACDITEKVKPYKKLNLDEKYKLMKIFVKEFYNEKPHFIDRIFLFESPDEIKSSVPSEDIIIIFKDAKGKFNIKNNSVFDIKTKNYKKIRSKIEIEFISSNLGHNARFRPYNRK